MSKTIFEGYNDCKKQLAAAGIEDSVFESKQIIKHITGYTSTQILMNYTKPLSEFQESLLTVIIKQRLIHYPLQYIICKWNFFGRDYFVGPGVLIPRSDTETLMDVCLEHIKALEAPRALDLCAGTGCIGITLKGECPNAQVTLVEKYDEALAFTNKNADSLGIDVKIVKGDVLCGEGAEGEYNLIVSNPPYITDEDMKKLQTEVSYEPETALAGGADGLNFYRAIIEKYTPRLKNGGVMAFEVGINQAEDVAQLMRDVGLSSVSTRKDMNGIERVVFGTAKKI